MYISGHWVKSSQIIKSSLKSELIETSYMLKKMHDSESPKKVAIFLLALKNFLYLSINNFKCDRRFFALNAGY